MINQKKFSSIPGTFCLHISNKKLPIPLLTNQSLKPIFSVSLTNSSAELTYSFDLTSRELGAALNCSLVSGVISNSCPLKLILKLACPDLNLAID